MDKSCVCLRNMLCVLAVICGVIELGFGQITTETAALHSKNAIKENIESTTDINNVITTERTVTEQYTKQHNTKEPATKPPTKTPKYPPNKSLDPMDRYLLDGILNIMDEKFETLNKRIMTLERGMNNLQYYNVRSFRVVNTHLHAIDTQLHGSNEHFNQLEHGHRSTQESIGSIKKEVLDLQSLNNDMFQAIEQNLVHFHQDMQSRFAEIKEGMDQSNYKINEVKNRSLEIRNDIDEMRLEQAEIVQNVEASIVMVSETKQATKSSKEMTEGILKIAESNAVSIDLIQSSLSTILGNMTSLYIETSDMRSGLASFLLNVTSHSDFEDSISKTTNEREETAAFQEFKAPVTKTQMACSRLFEIIDEKFKQINATLTSDQNVKCDIPVTYPKDFKNQSRKLIRALSTVNENVYQSVTLYRHTGNLIERILADTELVANEQIRLREDIIAFLTNGTVELFNRSLPEFTEYIDTSKGSGKVKKEEGHCKLTETLTEEIVKLTQNGTQLVELLTDLAETSATSMKTSLGKLDQEVTRLNKVQEESLSTNTFARDDPKAGGSFSMYNKTEMIYQLVEAIASNTGWIPYIFHTVRFAESQINKTLKAAISVDTKTEELLIRQRANMALMFKTPQNAKDEPAMANSKSSKLNKLVDDIKNSVHESKKSSKTDTLPKKPNSAVGATGNQSLLFNHMMDFVYETNVKMDRLIPALTTFLGEPEPYIALVNGQSDREGRVEIYHKGIWGTIAGSLTHIEASYVCRKLGYLGGISAGNGFFGAGTGAFWTLNVTCLSTRWCDAVAHVAREEIFSHSNDVGIICDHMLRIAPTDEENENVPFSGKLEVYHQNLWLPICFKGWGRKETNVVCRQLGFREGSASAVKDEFLLDAKWMMNAKCKGDENRLDACAYDGFEMNGCPDMKYVSIICS